MGFFAVVLIIFLFILIFFITVIYNVRKGLTSLAESGTKVQTKSPFSAEDNYKLLPDPMSEADRKESFIGSREPVITWDLSTDQFDRLGADNTFKSYSEDIRANVDQGIVKSHEEYIKDAIPLATVGASHASARDDFNPPVQFYGLPRRAHYAQWGSERSSRTSQSETPKEIYDIMEHHSTDYLL